MTTESPYVCCVCLSPWRQPDVNSLLCTVCGQAAGCRRPPIQPPKPRAA